jgi:hypothetical protein
MPSDSDPDREKKEAERAEYFGALFRSMKAPGFYNQLMAFFMGIDLSGEGSA